MQWHYQANSHNNTHKSKVKKKVSGLYRLYCRLTYKALRYGSHMFTCKLHHTYLPLPRKRSLDGVTTHHWLRWQTSNCSLLLIYRPERVKGWAGLVGWLIADGLPTLVVTRQLWIERRTGKVRWSETDVLYHCATQPTTNAKYTKHKKLTITQTNWVKNVQVCL